MGTSKQIHFSSFLLVLLLLSPPPPAVNAAALSSLAAGGPSLSGADTLVSPSGVFALGFYTPPSTTNRYIAVWFAVAPQQLQSVVWIMNRAAPVNGSAAAALSFESGGSLQIAAGRTVYWSANASARNPVAQLLDTGNLVVVDAASNAVVWQSFDHPTDTLLSEMKFGVDKTSGVSTGELTAWTSDSDPSPSAVRIAMLAGRSPGGDPDSFLIAGQQTVWRTGPWDGISFSGVPVTHRDFAFSFTDTPAAAFYTAHTLSSGLLSTLRLNRSGQVERWVWLDGAWVSYWYAPKDPCDYYNTCGINGVCDAYALVPCACLPGFAPANPARWALRDGRDGCARRTPLDCKNGSDGFAAVAHAKVPDTVHTITVLDAGGDVGGCRARCAENCSCTAYAAADAVNGTGCVMWFGELLDVRVYAVAGGQDLYVRLAAADLAAAASTVPSSSSATALAVSLSIAGAALAGALIFFLLWRYRRRSKPRAITPRRGTALTNAHSSTTLSSSGILVDDEDLELPLLDLDTVDAATGGFSAENKLGEGGFGPVYKGRLAEGEEIAVKRLAKTSMQGAEEFMNEVKLIARLQHRNLVRLLGCCIHLDERMLIYEFLPNGSLDALLFDKSRSAALDWRTRYRIIVGVARGLLYLHEDSRLRIIHRDLKASNILLDREMNPKISDFGMARIFGGDEKEINTVRVVGTYGYMSPEYAMDGVFSMKSDVFSFGILVLEVVSGRRNRGAYADSNYLSLLAHAWSLWKEGRILELVDETSLRCSCPVAAAQEEAVKCLKLGLLCTQEQAEDRPLMSEVIALLGRDSASSLPEPKQPGFFALKGPLEGLQESPSTTSASKLSDSTLVTSEHCLITITEGR